MGKCTDARPAERPEEARVAKKVYKLEDIGDLPVSVTMYAGCIEGDRAIVSARGGDRALLLYGTAAEVLDYCIGKAAALSRRDVPAEHKKKQYQRNVDAKSKIAINRVVDEMQGTGGIAEEVKKQQGQFAGYTLTANGTKVTADSVLNKFFKEFVFVIDPETEKPVQKPVAEVTDKDQLYLQKDKKSGEMREVKVLAVLDLIVSAIIKPGDAGNAGAYSRNMQY